MAGDWYRKSIKETLTKLKSSQKGGLTAALAAERLAEAGRNELKVKRRVNPFKLFLSQFNDVLIIILIIAAVVSLALSRVEENGSITESVLIFAIVIAIAVIGFLNEYKAERTIEALKKLIGQKAAVRRGGKELEIDAAELVPGDIVILGEGQKVPADIRLLQVKSLQINEASLTGESLPTSKNTFAIDKSAALGDQKNMCFSGTLVTTGTAEGVVVETGQSTEIGKIAQMVNDVEEEQTPMQRKLDELGRKLGVLILAICALVFIVVFFADKEIIDYSLAQRLIFAFTVAVALAVAAIPEGLSFVVRISLALGARRMAERKALVRKLSAVEALGSTDVICSDKTGTLTRGEMAVRKVWMAGKTYNVSGSGFDIQGSFELNGKAVKQSKPLESILRIGLLCNNAQLKDKHISGDPTEGALIVSAAKYGLFDRAIKRQFPRIDEIPFSSERKMMSTIHRMSHKYLVASKGAPDVLLEHCDRALVNGKVVKLAKGMKKEILAANHEMGTQALRVLGFAYKESNSHIKNNKEAENKLIFIGLQGMMDPPREEVKDVIHQVHAEAGMRVVMITGDFIETAKAVAAEIGIQGDAISGPEIDAMGQEEFERRAESLSVYARVNPEHKIRIVNALKKHGHQVAMTGDGVNDAPAVKAADIGIAMGITGTDATKEAADLILLDDQFLTIINAVEEGRGIFDNVRKFVSYLLGANISEVGVVLGGIIFFQNPVLTATQLLFINIVTDGLPAVALGSDPAEKGIMRYKPHHFQEAIINRHVAIEIFVFGVSASILLLWQFAFAHSTVGVSQAISAVFIAVVVYELVRLIVLRTNYNIPWFANIWLTVALAASLFIQIAAVYFEPLANLFNVGPIDTYNWIIIGIGSVAIFVVMKVTRSLLIRLLPEIRTNQHSAG